MEDDSNKILNADGKPIGFIEVHRGIDVKKDNRKVFCGIVKVLDEHEHEIATMACLPDVTLMKFPEGHQKTLKAPLTINESVIFYDEGQFESKVVKLFGGVIVGNRNNEQQMMQSLSIACMPFKKQKVVETVPLTNQYSASTAEQKIRKFPPGFSPN